MDGTRALYNTVCKWFAVLPAAAFPVTFFIDAPFGRFAPKGDSIFVVDGIKSWIIMELISPLTFIYTFLHAPLTPSHAPPPLSLAHPPTLLATLFLVHYANRALISPLRTPVRSRSHLIVPLSGALFNVANGGLLGAYLSSPAAAAYLAGARTRPAFWAALALWAAGFVGNIVHDEVLLNLRRTTQAKRDAGGDKGAPRYAIPYGYLHRYVSYPNYFCEWLEWLGFALAAAPVPGAALGGAAPPWLFLFAEVLTMFPRAYKGHAWYHSKFPDYPKDRHIVVPFLL